MIPKKVTSMKKKEMAFVSCAAACVMCAAALGGCAPQKADASSGEVDTYATSAYAYEGEFEKFDPEALAEITSGKAIEGSEEENLQQERIAGGAVGAVVSKNLEPLSGITDSSEGEFSGDLGIYGQPPARHEFDHGCLGCHDPLTADVPESTEFKSMPESHVNSNLTEEDCLSCHEAQ